MKLIKKTLSVSLTRLFVIFFLFPGYKMKSKSHHGYLRCLPLMVMLWRSSRTSKHFQRTEGIVQRQQCCDVHYNGHVLLDIALEQKFGWLQMFQSNWCRRYVEIGQSQDEPVILTNLVITLNQTFSVASIHSQKCKNVPNNIVSFCRILDEKKTCYYGFGRTSSCH